MNSELNKLLTLLQYNSHGIRKQLCFVLDQNETCGKLSCDACVLKKPDDFDIAVTQLEQLTMSTSPTLTVILGTNMEKFTLFEKELQELLVRHNAVIRSNVFGQWSDLRGVIEVEIDGDSEILKEPIYGTVEIQKET